MSKVKKIHTSERAFSIIQKPISTEKSTNLNQFNQYSFVVSKNSNSSEIKEAIQKIFKVKVKLDISYFIRAPLFPPLLIIFNKNYY